MTQKYFDEANAKKKVLGWARVEIEGDQNAEGSAQGKVGKTLRSIFKLTL